MICDITDNNIFHISCCICWENDKNILFVDCKHVCCCENCIDNLDE